MFVVIICPKPKEALIFRCEELQAKRHNNGVDIDVEYLMPAGPLGHRR